VTEEEWQESILPHDLIADRQRRAHLRSSSRKLRLFICACCHTLPDSPEWDRLANSPEWAVLADLIRLAERYVDGSITTEEMNRVRATDASQLIGSLHSARYGEFETALRRLERCVIAKNGRLWDCAKEAAGSIVKLWVWSVVGSDYRPEIGAEWCRCRDGKRVLVCNYFRDIFGNPFRPVAFDPRWR
jgi:hypothetical protein